MWRVSDQANVLRVRLGKAARHHANAALDCYEPSDCSGFYLHAGAAIELALKARLLEHGLFAIAPRDRDWFEIAMKLRTDPDSSKVQTVGGRDAITRLIALEPKAHEHLDALVGETIERWNQVKHLGLADDPGDEVFRAHTASFLRVVNVLLNIEAADFWGSRQELVAELVAEEQDAVALRVAERKVASRRRIDQLGGYAVEQLVESDSHSIAHALDEMAEHYVPYECPVCASPAMVRGTTIDAGDVEVEHDDGVIERWVPHAVLIVDAFECEICGYFVGGNDELAAAGIPHQVDNDRVDPLMLSLF